MRRRGQRDGPDGPGDRHAPGADSAPVEIVHTDLPQNDFGSLFALLASPSGYPAGRQEIYPSAIGRTLYGPLLPERQLLIGWSGITLHWLSTVPVAVPDQIYPNLVTGPAESACASSRRTTGTGS